MDCLQEIEQKSKYFAKLVFINLSFLKLYLKHMRGDVFSQFFRAVTENIYLDGRLGCCV